MENSGAVKEQERFEMFLLGEFMVPENTQFAKMGGSEAFSVAAQEGLTIEDFSSPVHRLLYRIIKQLHEKKKVHDAFALLEKLYNSNKLDKVGGTKYISLIESYGVLNELEVKDLARLIKKHI